MKENYSVLMSVYVKEQPEYLFESIDSILKQTYPTNDIVLVCDGPLTDELNAVIEEFRTNNSQIFNVIRLDSNVGLGKALNIALPYCKNELVARMDTDDIAINNRCELQIEMFEKLKDVDIIGSPVLEFEESIDKITHIRKVPETHKEILKYSKSRSPFNHPTVMFRKSKILELGGYKDFYLHEDYYLWVRMLHAGMKGYNIQVPLLYMRTLDSLYKRRGGKKYFASNKRFQKHLLSMKYINRFQYCRNVFIRFTVQILFPNKLRRFFYKKFLRKKA